MPPPEVSRPLLEGGETQSRNTLGAINGCYVPCLLNILGAVLYLRIGWAVGQMGMMGALGILFLSQLIAYLTVTSFSAIVTNGKMKGGGAYYMISRNLGPAFGGSRCAEVTSKGNRKLPLLAGRGPEWRGDGRQGEEEKRETERE